MKICLIDPPILPEDLVGDTISIKSVVNIIPSLGLAYIAAVLEKNGYEVKIIDCTLGISHLQLSGLLKKEKPNIIGITGATSAFRSMKKVAQDIKKHLPPVPVIVGGAHLTAAAEYTMGFDCFDVGIIGEGEITFLEVVREFERNGLTNLSGIDGIVFRKNGGIFKTRQREFIKDLDSLPYPARHLQPPLAAYRPTPASYKRLPQGVLITTRGCPSKCTFCDRAVFGTTYRERSAEKVIEEVEELIYKFGAREIRFFDDTFTLNGKRVFAICNKFKERKIKIPWTCLTKVANVSKEMLKAMKEAGCWQVLYGLESGDERILKLLKKGNTVEQNRKAVRLAKEVGLSVRADFIVGTPGETLESLKRTLSFAIKVKVDYAHFNKFVPYPGTELYELLKGQGHKFDFTNRFSIIDHSTIFFVPESMNREEFKEFLDYANRAFYLRPKYILKRLLSIRSWIELKGQINGFFAIYNL
ncbi:MAG: radical SAM protein [Candidatus Omnitrophica bacterium]|nr:radical SAM protein [Candidatus Omnitrophota bacterium]